MRKLRYGMVGGGRDAFIGAVHRKAVALDGQAELVAGALSSSPDKAKASGRELGLPDARNYGSWEEMLEAELRLPAQERIDFVSIVTPNHLHYPVAKAFAEAGIHVVCDKPLVHNSEQAHDLIQVVERSGVVFAVTYNYTGYPMVKQARDMVKNGVLGPLRKVIVEYNQGWLATQLEASHQKQAEWRTDPARSGIAGAVGDIGSHAENLAATITGLELEQICADLTTFVPGRRLDDDGNLLLRFVGGAKGLLWCSQVEIGAENDLRIRIFGEKGSLTWHQEDPNVLIHDSLEGPRQVLTRGNAYLCPAAQRATRLPTGHPEAFIEAFANVYLGAMEAIRAKQEGRALGENEGDFPTVYDGARGVYFIEKTVESSRSDQKWTEARWKRP
ncbi:Gfo/Idh/MocA family protein [Meiothermus granaticius]|uniref:Glucose-6-phosphate 3-dehydrogenase n=1 Tax=Meiothermus granaticius NBRC 107808 TaxID=1227551 RepID=A0A399FAR4_9DEIN|nr:Gfo/Idh/MocA family oxidoreductase [Meiothermus granaticius]RIH92786.1 Glucose-6-phosphate 3-dehydrogenase [Meiothermus granaticius NBRC 107808]GEM87364.1 oxidoreductase [Meiothermus granaticius NBRC 107808]